MTDYLVAILAAAVAASASNSGSAITVKGEAKVSHAELVDWTPAISIERRQLYRSVEKLPNGIPQNFGSPDGRYFWVLSHRGDIACNCNRSMLQVFISSKVSAWVTSEGRSPPKPLATFSMRGVANMRGQAIPTSSVQWKNDSSSLVFVGSDGRYVQVYRIDFPAGKLRKLTSDPYPKSGIIDSAPSIIYRRDVEIADTLPSVPAMVPVVRDADGYVSYPGSASNIRQQLVVRVGRNPPWVISPPGVRSFGTISIAPTGTNAVLFGREGFASSQWLLNFRDKTYRKISALPPADARYAVLRPDRGNVFWTADGSWALLVASGLPGEVPSSEEEAKLHVIAYHVDSGRWQKLETLTMNGPKLRATGWLRPGELLVAHEFDGKPSAGAVYRLEGGNWIGHEVGAEVEVPTKARVPLAGGLKLVVKEGPNDPPMLVASVGDRSKSLSNPDPVLQGVWRAKSEPFEWTMPDGQKLVGALMLPRGISGGLRPPVVIQIGAIGYAPDEFAPEGFSSSGFAAQAMVARGLAVLTFNYRDLPQPPPNSPPESELKVRSDLVEAVDRAVEALSANTLIDSTKIGVTGFSRSGFLVYHLVTHPGRSFITSAIANDSTTNSLVQHMQSVIVSSATVLSAENEEIYGGSPWEKPQGWWDADPQLNAYRTKAALLFTQHVDAGRNLNEMSMVSAGTIASQERYRRAFEYLFFPDGGHNLSRPKQRLASLSANTDWMDFWLNGHEDPAPEKAEQYARWRKLKARQAKFDAERAARTK